MKKYKTNRKNISWGLKDAIGKLLTTKEDILERWANFYEDLYSDPTIYQPIEVDPSESAIPRILKIKIEKAILKMIKDWVLIKFALNFPNQGRLFNHCYRKVFQFNIKGVDKSSQNTPKFCFRNQ